MRVFIGWSGEPSVAVGRCLNGWLPRVLQEIKPFFSEEAIALGSPWLNALMNGLQRQDFFIACVTRESLEAAWFNFEVGVAAGALFEEPEKDKRVCPVLYGIEPTDVPQPVGIFQGVKADQAGIFKLVEVLNSKLDQRLADGDLAATFEKWWPDLQTCLASIAPSAPAPERSTADILTELLTLARYQTANSYDALISIMRIADAQEEIKRQLPQPPTGTFGGLAGILGGLVPVRGGPLPASLNPYQTAVERAMEEHGLQTPPSLGEPPTAGTADGTTQSS
jgi:hypothetical protein